MSTYLKMPQNCWHEECIAECGECTGCTSCKTRDGDQLAHETLYNRYMTVGSVRYGMRLRAVSPPPPGAGPRYRSQCCWPNFSTTTVTTSGPVSRVPLLSTAPINNFDIISCANRVRIPEDATSASATSTSELSQQPTVRDNVLYSSKCLLKRCALVRPQVYTRLCDHADAKPDEEEIFNTLDRLPRFRFGGNRAGSTKSRDFDKKGGEQRFKELTDRFKKGPVPPPRTRHGNKTPPATALPQPNPPVFEENNVRLSAPLRSASFSQVDFCSDNNKYVRRRQLPEQDTNQKNESQRGVVTLPRSKNISRCSPMVGCKIIPKENINPSKLQEEPNEENQISESQVPVNDQEKQPSAETINNDSTNSSSGSSDLTSQEKKKDKSKRRKGIYIAQWPNNYNCENNVIPNFNDSGNLTSCSESDPKFLQESLIRMRDLPSAEEKKQEFPIWSSPQEEPLSPEESTQPPEWPNSFNQRLDDRDMLKVPRNISINLLRSDSLSEGEPDGSERRSDQSYLGQSDVSDCESRLSVGNDSYNAKRYSKRPLRGPYGLMLEAEMKKPEAGRKNLNPDLKFLEDLSSSSAGSSMQNIPANKSKYTRSRASCNSSFDDSQTKGGIGTLLSSPKQTLCKRKVSADNLVSNNNDGEQKMVVNHQRTTSSPSKLEGFANPNASEFMEQLLRTSSERLAASDSSSQRNNDTRTHVLVELYDNERIYVESLQILITKYLEPLKSPENASLLDSALVDEIFYPIPFLLNHHQEFLEEMKKRLEHWDVKQKIGDVFLEMFSKPEVIECYTNYVNNWKRAREIIKNAQQSKPAFAKFIEATAREHKGKLALDSLLIKPIQKFPKYELLLQRLIKHTDVNHPDHSLLLAAQKEVHDQLFKINCTERETLELEQLREIESLIEGLIELVSTDRQYLRNDIVSMTAGGGTRKDRSLFLFSDLLLVTSIKRRSGPIRRPTTGSGSVTSSLEANKYKLLMKIPLEDLEIVRSKDENLRQMMAEMDNLTEDIGILNQINELSWSLHCNHSQLDDVVRDMLASLNKQLIEQQSSDSQLSCLNLTLNTSNGLENIPIVFSKPEKRASWEESFLEAKHKLAISGERKPCPELVAMVPIRKTRAGLQFTCAAPTLGDNGKDVWVCNSDGYVGQVCILSLLPEPTVTSCNGVCNARILCVASVPGISYSLSVNNRNINSNRDENEDPKTMQFDSSSSSDEEYKSDIEDAEDTTNKNDAVETSSIDADETDNMQSTMWLGTEDGCIHVYNSSDNIRTKKNKIRLQLNSSILSIIYLENRVFVSLANGDISIYDRDSRGWNINSPTTVSVGSTAMPVSKMLPNSNKLWCGCGSNIKVFNTQTLLTEKTFTVNNDSNKPITCLVLSGNGVWLSLQNSAIVKCFHAVTFESLCEVNVAPAVTKMLTSCDDIIRQHKAACLRVTALLSCKDLLWVGTSAGVLLTMPLPHVPLTTNTGKLTCPPIVSGVSHGHTGHVRFLTHVEIPASDNQAHRNSYKGKQEQRAAKTLVISGGDGYEDFRSTNLSEVAGREDSTNHLLLWNI